MTTSAPPLPAEAAGIDLWGAVVGQDDAVAQLRTWAAAPVHAYLFVGGHGTGKKALARAFAGALVSAERTGDDAARHATLALNDAHPDVTLVQREGASISADDARSVIKTAMRSSVEGGPKVVILDEFHLLGDRAPILLKTIEEPPPGTVFIVLADEVPPDLVTIASRCVRIDLAPLTEERVVQRLIDEGVPDERARSAAAAAGGDLGRARVLATDERLALRLAAWTAVPGRLDGTGGRAVALVDSLLAMIDDAMAPLTARHEAEAAEVDERIKEIGARGSGRKQLEDRHKREARRYRTDEIRAGFAAMSRRYRDDMLTAARPARDITAIGLIAEADRALVRNGGERLQLVALFLRLGALPA